MRRAHRLDSNHAELVKAFEKLGCSVLSLAGIGSGCPDICVGFAGLQIMCELKDGSRPPSARKLTEDEERFRMNWKGGYRLVENLDHVQDTVNVLKSWQRAIYESLRPAPPAATECHTDHPMRVWDRTCPACNPGEIKFHSCGLADCPFCLDALSDLEEKTQHYKQKLEELP